MPNETTETFIKARHPEYAAHIASWESYSHAYKGGPDYARNCIIPHESEDVTGTAFQLRLKHAFPINYPAFVVDRYVSYLTKEPPKVKDADFQIAGKPFIEDVDRQGMTLQEAVGAISRPTVNYGMMWILVDKPRIENKGTVRTLADDDRDNIRPYWVFLSPQSVPNWGCDDSGSLLWALIAMPVKDVQLDYSIGGAPRLAETEEAPFTLWTRDIWVKLNKDGVPVGLPTFHNLGIVPIVPVKVGRDIDGGFVPKSMMADIVPLNSETINTFSLLQEINYNQTFSKFVAKQGSIAPDNVSPESVASQTVAVGTKSVVEYIGDVAPSFISPDAGQAQVLLNSIDLFIKQIMVTANLQKGMASESGQVASGIAHAFVFLDTNQTLLEIAANVGGGIIKALIITAKWNGAEIDPSVEFPRDFGIETGAEIITRYRDLMLADGQIPPALRKEYLLKIARAEFPNAEDELIEEIEKALEEAKIEAQTMGAWAKANAPALPGDIENEKPGSGNVDTGPTATHEPKGE